MKSWLPGEQIAIRGIVHNRVWIAHPVTVVQDTADLLQLFADGSPLFDRRWLDWRPDPQWGIPSLPDDWQIKEAVSTKQ